MVRYEKFCAVGLVGAYIYHYSNTFTLLVPGAPEGVTYRILTDTIVQLYWNPPDNPNGIIRSYQIIYHSYRLNQTVSLQQMQRTSYVIDNCEIF